MWGEVAVSERLPEFGGCGTGRGRGFGQIPMNKEIPKARTGLSSNISSSADTFSNDCWDEGSGNSSSVRNNWGNGDGFGTSSGRQDSWDSDNNSNSWKPEMKSNSSNYDNSSGGGGRSKRGCFKCGEDGHMSRECPQNSSGGNNACFKCGQDGHKSRECPSSSGGKRGCFKCGEEGHMSRECPNGDHGRDKRGGSKWNNDDDDSGTKSFQRDKKSSGCFKCGQDGHMAKDCTEEGSGKTRSGCFNCGKEGHISKDCTEERKGPDGQPRPAPYIPPEPTDDEDKMFESVPTGINFSKYDDIPVDVSGTDVPNPITSFDQAKFLPTLTQNIEKSKYTKPTPVQKYAIPIILAKRDLMACAQTGSGKTAAFLLPIIQDMFVATDLPNPSFRDTQEPWALVLSPTRELAIQIYNEARKFALGSIIKVELIYGGTSVGYQSQKLKRGCHILVATPGRLLDFVEKDKVSFAQLRYLILDEADRMLDMGFAPEIRKMVQNPNMPEKGQRQTLMFSATFPPEIQRLASDFLDNYLFLTVGIVGGANSDVEQTFYQVAQFDKRKKLTEILSETGTDRTLVFVEQKRTADFIASYMSQHGYPTTSIHGDRLQREREEALRDFRTGHMPILVATAVAARGLDIKDVRHVINYDLPESIQEYVHRIGRTGRVGNLGKATSFYDSGTDQPLASSLLKVLQDSHQCIPDWLQAEGNNIGSSQQSFSRGYGSRDVRRFKDFRNNDGGRDFSNNDSSAVITPQEEEIWE